MKQEIRDAIDRYFKEHEDIQIFIKDLKIIDCECSKWEGLVCLRCDVLDMYEED